jgi:biopolymer transport protein ExbB/TolQ
VSRITTFSEWLLKQPLVWGSLASLAFYAALHQGWIESQLVRRYTASHEIEYVTVILFFIGLAALVLRLMSNFGQHASFNQELLDPFPPGGQPVEDVQHLLDGLADLPEVIQRSYLVQRLGEALRFVRAKGSADSLDEQLHHLEEADAVRMSSGYGMVRIVIWAIPILGFLGTVVGITMAIAGLKADSLENSLTEVTSQLALAFDTTALSLALSMVLMFLKFFSERVEDQLLAKVDARVSAEMVGRFQATDAYTDPNVATIRKMSLQVVQAVENMAARQAQVWKQTIDESHEQWAEVTAAAGQILENSLANVMRQNYDQHAQKLNEGALEHAQRLNAGAQQTVSQMREGLEKLAELLVEALHQHGESLARSETELAQENRRHLCEVEAALGEAMVLSADRQEKLIRQSEQMVQELQHALGQSTITAADRHEHLLRHSEQLLNEMRQALSDSAGATLEQQQQLVKQGEVLLKVVEATGQVQRLEDALNHNLASLGRAHHFEETLMSLSAAVQLLSARLGYTQPPHANISIQVDPPKSNAA